MSKWIKIQDEAEYNLTDIAKEHECSDEEAIEIAEEWFGERSPIITISEEEDDSPFNIAIKEEHNLEDDPRFATLMDITEYLKNHPIEKKEKKRNYTLNEAMDFIEKIKEICRDCNIKSLKIDNNKNVFIEF